MTDAPPTVYAVIYNFMCPACKRINTGKKLYRAPDPEAASHRLSTFSFHCVECSPASNVKAGAKTYVSIADENDLANYPIEPDAP